MIAWWWIIPAVIAGAMFGVILLALCSTGRNG